MIVDMGGKAKRLRTVAVPVWIKKGIEEWKLAAGINEVPREAEGVQMGYRGTCNGTDGNGPLNLYEYTSPIDPFKTVESLTLPDNRHVVALAITLDKDWP